MSRTRYRRATEEDLHFVVESWLASYRTSYSAGLIAMSCWHEVMRPQLQHVLGRAGCEVLVAFDAQAYPGSEIMGWIAGEPDPADRLVHYCYVKEFFRRQGLATGLFRRLGFSPEHSFTYSCKTPVVSKLVSHLPGARFNPLQARFAKKEENVENTGNRSDRSGLSRGRAAASRTERHTASTEAR